MTWREWLAIGVLALISGTTLGQPQATPGRIDHGWVLGTHIDVAPGKLKDTTSLADTKNYVYRGRIISLLKDRSVGLAFDTDLMRVAGAWVGRPVTYVSARNMGPEIDGAMIFETRPGPGWAIDDRWDDARPHKEGPLPHAHAHYQGLYLHGERVLLSYSVGPTQVLEMPDAEVDAGVLAVTRSFEIAPSNSALSLLVCESPGGQASVDAGIGTLSTKDRRVAVSVAPTDAGVRLEAAGSRLHLKIPASKETIRFRLALVNLPMGTDPKAAASFAKRPVDDLRQWTKGGPRWGKEIAAKCTMGDDAVGAYVVDRIGLPEANPWNASVRFTGLDFFPDGRAALCTWDGDVWIASGFGKSLDSVRWRRFAAGLQQPVGLKIVGGVIHTAGRDQITRLHDLNGDGEADLLENFNNDAPLTLQRHEYVMDLQTDAAGNFYFARSGHYIPSKSGANCVIYKLSPNGKTLEVFARGFREPNGLSIGPDGVMTVGDNEGNTIPQSPLYRLKQGAFYGFTPAAGKKGSWKSSEPAMVWLPKNVDRSPGGQVWSPSDGWGPFANAILHTSYGNCFLFAVLIDKQNDLWQAAVWKFPLTFESGIMRPRFHPVDGQLWVAGLRGYDTTATRDGQLARVRFTGRAAAVPVGFRVVPGAIEVSFSEPLERKWAEDDQNWSFDSNGPPPKSSAKLTERTIESIALSDDGRTARIAIDDLAPAMNFTLAYRLKDSRDGPVNGALNGTIHVVPKR